MKLLQSILACTALALAAGFSGIAAAADNIALVYNGLAVPNTSSAPNIQAFTDWCNQSCIPTVQQPVYDPSTGKQKGFVYVWATVPFQGGSVIPSSFCFSEFFVFALDRGDLYAHSGPSGTCGAIMDPVLSLRCIRSWGLSPSLRAGAMA